MEDPAGGAWALDWWVTCLARSHWSRQAFRLGSGEWDGVCRHPRRRAPAAPRERRRRRVPATDRRRQPLHKDYERLPAVSETFIQLAMIHLLLRRVSRADPS